MFCFLYLFQYDSMTGRLRLAEISCRSIKHVSIDNLSPGTANFLQEELIICSELVSDRQQLRVRLEVEVNLVHQQVGAHSLRTKIQKCKGYKVFFIFSPSLTLNICLDGVVWGSQLWSSRSLKKTLERREEGGG